METRAHFALIGAFTLAIVTAAFGFVYWFSGGVNSTALKSYRIVFNSSVSGLTRGSIVTFNGLRVGEVSNLALGDDPSQVYASISVDARIPVKTDTRARLDYQGFTGVASVALLGGGGTSSELKGTGGAPPTLVAERSDYQNILDSVRDLSAKAGDLLDKADRLVSENAAAIDETVKNAQQLSSGLDTLVTNANAVLASVDTKKLSATVDGVSAFAQTLAQNREATTQIFKNTEELTAKLNASAERVNGVLASTQAVLSQLGKFSGPGLRNYDSLATDGRRTLRDLDSTMSSLKRDPQQVIFGAKPTVPEYGGK